jgi:chromosome segregation ATPase
MASPLTSPRAAALLWTVSIGLAAGMYYQYRTASPAQPGWAAKVNQMSNALHGITVKLDEQRLVNSALERELSVAVAEANGYSNMLSRASADLAKVNQAKSRSEAQPQLADPRVGELENERDGLNAKLEDLSGAMAKLDDDLAETKRKLEASEGDRGALLQELKRLEADRANLMLRFNDLAMLREQMRKLKAEQSVSRRLAWMRRGVYGSAKGAELLHKNLASAAPAGNYDLNVEVRRSEATPGPTP